MKNFQHRRLFYIHHFCLIYKAANDILTYDSCWFQISSSIKHKKSILFVLLFFPFSLLFIFSVTLWLWNFYECEEKMYSIESLTAAPHTERNRKRRQLSSINLISLKHHARKDRKRLLSNLIIFLVNYFAIASTLTDMKYFNVFAVEYQLLDIFMLCSWNHSK